VIFLDAAATTPVRREVLEAMWPHLSGEFGNPSSHHSLGNAAATALAGARAATATALGCRPAEIIFTSGGTEADNLAVKGIALGRRAADPGLDRVAISAVEHPAVQDSARYLERVHGFAVDVIPVDSRGQVTVAALAAVLRPETALVSVMYANNEVGTVQPVARLAALARAHGIPFHSDAVQAAGWLPLDTAALGVDALSISGHKLGAPKGNGALFVRGRTRLEPLIHGGGQERGRRSGTENVAGADFASGQAGGPGGAHRSPARWLHRRRPCRCSRRPPDRPPQRAASLRGVVLFSGDKRRGGVARARTPGCSLLERLRLRRGLG
jgi:cysteine desulfurase